jgi:Fe-S cluster biogenesis protein NfuA
MEEKIKKIIEKFRPYIKMHGGDVDLVEIVDGNPSTSSGQVVKIKVVGACVGCTLANETYNVMLRGMIQEEYPEVVNLIIEN